MAGIETGLYELGRFDRLAASDTPAQRIDPRAKVLATLVYLVCVVSFGRYEVAGLIPFAVFPMALAIEGDLPADLIWRRLLLASPFAIVIGMFNPLLDRAVVGSIGAVAITAGWVSFASIALRFLLTAAAALTLVGTTGMNGVCAAIERLGAPDVFATQLLFLYRYIFVLAEEAMTMARARALRSFGSRGMGMRAYANLLGTLLLRTYARARRVYDAMACRGFDGRVRLERHLRFQASDWAFLLGWSAAFVALRVWDVAGTVGRLVVGVWS